MINFFMQCGKSIKTCINYIRKNGDILQKFAVNQSDDRGIFTKIQLIHLFASALAGKSSKECNTLEQKPNPI